MSPRRPVPTPRDPIELDAGRACRILLRGARRRCPHCGGGPLFRRWLFMAPTCPGCHLRLDRGEPDYFIGGYLVNFVAAELLVCAGALAGILLTWPEVPWGWIQAGLFALVIPAPVFFYPWAKTLWLAVDLVFRPVTLADLEGHGENLPPEARPGRSGAPPAGI